MKRKHGTALVANEEKILAAILRLTFSDQTPVHGYHLHTHLATWEDESAVNHGTLYRCLRELESRGLLLSEISQVRNRLRVLYTLTPEGVEQARKSLLRLAASDTPPSWADISLAIRPLPGA